MPQLLKFDVPPSLRELAYNSLKEAIISDKLKSGEIYNEKGLAHELGISKTPVREALLDLAGKGFLTIIPRKGIIVNTLSDKDICALFEFRTYIEAGAVRKIALTLTEKELMKLEAILKKGEKAAKKLDLMAFMKSDREFHVSIIAFTENKYTISATENIRDLCDWLTLKLLSKKGNANFCVDEHNEIFQMLKRRDPDGAATKVTEHIHYTQKMLLPG